MVRIVLLFADSIYVAVFVTIASYLFCMGYELIFFSLLFLLIFIECSVLIVRAMCLYFITAHSTILQCQDQIKTNFKLTVHKNEIFLRLIKRFAALLIYYLLNKNYVLVLTLTF